VPEMFRGRPSRIKPFPVEFMARLPLTFVWPLPDMVPSVQVNWPVIVKFPGPVMVVMAGKRLASDRFKSLTVESLAIEREPLEK